MDEQQAATWASHGVHVLKTIESHTDRLDRHGASIAELRDLVRENGRLVRSAARLWGGVVSLVVVLVVAAGSRYVTLQVDAALAPAAVSSAERIDAIADVLGDIGTGPGMRLQSGRPSLRAVQAALPQMRGIKAAEIEAACLQVPAECRRP